ncbi:hypothetical protein [Gordonia tangerina]|uniref:Uncharacterized protein n=1 Tax=Gordonia tangerina TaxID=2911060 RepID=A0ABS9DQ13_9ACTN|nr:hypothetical protein [Gordonia tangerina]MCF3941320.1 hypothetical protein [Gordonia tangerina]
MTVPDGYAVAPTAADHLCKIAVPVPDRESILIEMPKLNWMPPEEVEAYGKWLRPLVEAETQIEQWHKDNDELPEEERTPFPSEAQKLLEKSPQREIKIRWVKPYVSAADYKTLTTSKKIAERTIDWVVEQISSADIDLGESSASTGS